VKGGSVRFCNGLSFDDYKELCYILATQNMETFILVRIRNAH
jgi:hypothetical protein